MSETIETETVTQTNGVEDKTSKSDTLKDEDERKSSVAFNNMLSNRMEVEEGKVEPKGSSNVSSSASKIKLLVGGIVFVILIIIIIALMLPKTAKQNESQLWRINKNDFKLDNLYSSSWEFETKTWTIPSDGEEGLIAVKDSNSAKVLVVNGEDVVLEDKAKNSTSSQLWIKGPNNSDGYFWLKHKETGKFLTLCIHKVKEEGTTLISVKDFIVGHDESTLEVGHAGAGLNAGGITAGITSQGVEGCTGKLVITPPFKKGDIEKTQEVGFVEVFKIWANKEGDKLRSTEITVEGTCCWDIYHRLGDSQRDLKPGQHKITPSVAFIRTLKTKKC